MSRAGVARTIGVVLAVLALAGCGTDETWKRAIGRWGNGVEEIQLKEDGSGVYWTKHPIETRQFRWIKEPVEAGTYRLTMAFDDGSKRVFLAQPKAIDELVLLTDEKLTHAIMSPVAEKDFAKPGNAIEGFWDSADESKSYCFNVNLCDVTHREPGGGKQISKTSGTMTVTSPSKNHLVIEVDRDGTKETLAADYDEADGSLTIKGKDFADKVFRRSS